MSDKITFNLTPVQIGSLGVRGFESILPKDLTTIASGIAKLLGNVACFSSETLKSDLESAQLHAEIVNFAVANASRLGSYISISE